MGIDTRDRIVAAGLELFAKYGFGQVGLDQVVQQAKLTKTTFYNHFESKEQLIREVLALQESRVRERLSDETSRLSGGEPKARLLAIFQALPDLIEQERLACHMLISATSEYPSEHDPIHKAATRSKLAFNEMITQWAREANAPAPETLGHKLGLLFHGAVLDRLLDHSQSNSLDHARQTAELVINAAWG